MTTSTTEKTPAAADEPGVGKKPHTAGRKASLTATKAQSRQTRKGGKASPKTEPARQGSKTAKILHLVKRPGGATLKDLVKATGWQAHSVRGFLSGMRQKMGLAVTSTQSDNRERSYLVKP
jgi:hypothetical protein